jgi:hypothetical protein
MPMAATKLLKALTSRERGRVEKHHNGEMEPPPPWILNVSNFGQTEARAKCVNDSIPFSIVKTEHVMDDRTKLILIRALTVRKHGGSQSTLTLCPGTEIFAAIGDTGPLVKLTFQSRPGFFLIDRSTLEISTRPLQSNR